MALPTTSKKVFTTLHFQAGATLHQPKVHLLTGEELGNLNNLIGGELAYSGSPAHLKLYDGSNWQDIHRTGVALSTGSQFTVSVANGTAPFAITSSTRVDGLNVQYLSGSEASNALGNNTVPVRDANNLFHVGSATANPTENTHVANKRYVDSVAQGLTIIDPCYLATTAALPNHSYNNGTNGVGATMTASANGALSIDGNAVSNGKRILVKDQANNAHNGIYTVTNAGSGSAAFVLTRATDYDEQGELLDGDFVFVQEGTVNANRGFVQTSNFWTATTGTVGTHSITWTQFSGAGQISVTSNGSAVAPLTKSGDTINFAYNTDRFALNSNALDIKADGILSTHIADGQIVPAQLVNTSSFTMGGLGVGGAASELVHLRGTSDPTLRIQDTSGNQGDTAALEFTISSNVNIAGARIDAVRQSDDTIAMRFFGGDGSSIAHTTPQLSIDGSSKKIGIGADATNPSGTLHISTARYGSHLITGDYSDYSVADDTASTDSRYGWSRYGDNTLQVVSEQLVVAYAGGTNAGKGAYRYFRASNNAADLVIGKSYKVSIDLKYSGSGTAPQVRAYNGTSYESSFGTLTTSLVTYTTTFEAAHEENAFVAFTGLGSGQSITIDNLTIQEDTLTTAGTLSVNSAADDLVIANNDDAGISILSPKTKKGNIYFGDKDGNTRGVISFDHNTDHLTFGLGGDGAGNYSFLIDNSRDAKFAGHIGAGNMVADGVISGKTPSDGFPAIQMFSHDSKAIFQVRDAANSCLVKLYDNAGGTVSQKVELHTNGTSYFNGGSVAIGGTTATAHTNKSTLNVNGTWGGVIENSVSNTPKSRWNWNTSGRTEFGTIVDEPLDIHVNAAVRLTLNSDGTQDHKSNSIVNSASIAGLQDNGACYDFNGTTSSIDLGAEVIGTGAVTVSAWVKSDDYGEYGGNNYGRIVDNGTQYLYIASGSSGLILFKRSSGGTAAQAPWPTSNHGKWIHVAATSTAAGAIKIYINGVDSTTTAGAGSPTAGTSNTFIGNSSASDRTWDGSIRDVKIFPSELDAADVRKLYSGENPKKNDNVELVVSGSNWVGDFDVSGDVSAWSSKSDGALAHESGRLKITGSGGDGTYGAEAPAITTTDGKTYLLEFDYESTGNWSVRVGSSSGNQEIVAAVTNSSGSGTHRVVFTATTSSAFITFYELTADKILYLDNVSVVEVGTLVDLTPQSASSSKWRNEAIPSLYNGTVNNATLSQGNTYWNNIKQDERNITLNGHFTDDGNHNYYRVGIKNDDPQDTLHIGTESLNRHGTIRIAGFNNNEYWRIEPGTNTLGFKDWDGTSLFTLNGSSNTVQINDKLGVGGVASDCTLRVAGSSEFENTIFLGDHQGYRGLISWSGDFDSGVGSAHSHMVLAGSNTAANAGIQFKTRTGSAHVDAGVISAEGNWGIGVTSTGCRLTIKDAVDNSNESGLRIIRSADGASAWLNCRGGAFNINTRNHAGNASIPFQIKGHGTEWLRITDGTQDHKGNRIVNSQTLNDSWRTSEPSLRFDGVNDYVNVPSSSSNKCFDGDFSVSFWLYRVGDASGARSSVVGKKGSGWNDIGWHCGLNNDNGGELYFHAANGSGNTHVNSSYVVPKNKWVHATFVRDKSAGTLKLYVNGSLDNTGTSSTYFGIDLNNDVALRIGTLSGWWLLEKEVRDVRIHNRALEADEVKGLYNGESTPHIYENALATNKGSGTWYTGSSSSAYYLALTSVTSTGFTWDNTADDGRATIGDNAMTLVAGKRYRLQANINRTSSAGGPSLYVRNTWDSGTTLASLSWASSTNNTLISVDFTCPDDDVTYALSFSAGGVSAGTVSDISLHQVGEVAAYTPQSIGETRDNGTSGNGKKWYDTTTNSNDGTITGATKVGRTHLGRLDIGTGGGSSAYDLDVGETGKGKLNRIDFYDSNRYIERDSNDLTFYSHYSGFKFNAGSVSGSTRTGGICLQVNADRSVTASNTSGNLKQVARVHSQDLDGDGSSDYVITHNLGTADIVVSVRSRTSPHEHVECAIVSNGDATSTDNDPTNKCMVRFASAQASGTNYKVTVIG